MVQALSAWPSLQSGFKRIHSSQRKKRRQDLKPLGGVRDSRMVLEFHSVTSVFNLVLLSFHTGACFPRFAGWNDGTHIYTSVKTLPFFMILISSLWRWTRQGSSAGQKHDLALQIHFKRVVTGHISTFILLTSLALVLPTGPSFSSSVL